jgi:hypothetical protein
MRIRSIKPEYWDDELVGSWDSDSRLGYIWTWQAADDSGVLRLSAGLLRRGAFAFREIPLPRIERMINLFIESGRIVTWKTGTDTYGAILRFHKHQRVDHPSKSFLPPIPEAILASMPDHFREGYARTPRGTRETLATGSRDTRESCGNFTYRARDAGTEEPRNRGTEEPRITPPVPPHPNPAPEPQPSGQAPAVAGGPAQPEPGPRRRKSAKKATKPPAPNHSEVEALFEYWREICQHPQSSLPDPGDLSYERTSEWLRKIGLDACKAVVRGAREDAENHWHERRLHDTLDILFRDHARVEKFRGLDPASLDGRRRSEKAMEGPTGKHDDGLPRDNFGNVYGGLAELMRMRREEEENAVAQGVR